MKYKSGTCYWRSSVLLPSSLVTYCSKMINSLRTGPKPEVLPSTGYTFLANWLPKNSSFLAVVCFIRSVYHYFLIFSRFADMGGYRQTPLQEPRQLICSSRGSFGFKYRHSRHTFIISDHVLIGVILNSGNGTALKLVCPFSASFSPLVLFTIRHLRFLSFKSART